MVKTAADEALADQVVLAAIKLTRTLQGLNRGGPLTPPQIGALVVIAWSDGIPARDLAAWQQVTPATISRLVAELETKGLIVRKNDDKDRRVQWIRATPEGAALVRREHGRRLAPLAAAIAVLPAGKRKDVERAVRMLETLTEASIAQQDSP